MSRTPLLSDIDYDSSETDDAVDSVDLGGENRFDKGALDLRNQEDMWEEFAEEEARDMITELAANKDISLRPTPSRPLSGLSVVTLTLSSALNGAVANDILEIENLPVVNPEFVRTPLSNTSPEIENTSRHAPVLSSFDVFAGEEIHEIIAPQATQATPLLPATRDAASGLSGLTQGVVQALSKADDRWRLREKLQAFKDMRARRPSGQHGRPNRDRDPDYAWIQAPFIPKYEYPLPQGIVIPDDSTSTWKEVNINKIDDIILG
ncbi:hypothetical protein Dda_7088 [Drechslerella dactyloides]|uniref:Uncharacterized protein n=1 Tax=Drechslerella dactyloides TaxID=74499 RepID=A0AAD6IT51_DREDA|nr:hypothetical protein Dda_7088 [Drechslerella dactyloides]